MQIETVTNKNIIFDNGDVISYVPEDESNYGEYSYADFMQLEAEVHTLENKIKTKED